MAHTEPEVMTEELAKMLNRALARHGVIPLFAPDGDTAAFFAGLAFLAWTGNDGEQTLDEQAVIASQLKAAFDKKESA